MTWYSLGRDLVLIRKRLSYLNWIAGLVSEIIMYYEHSKFLFPVHLYGNWGIGTRLDPSYIYIYIEIWVVIQYHWILDKSVLYLGESEAQAKYMYK